MSEEKNRKMAMKSRGSAGDFSQRNVISKNLVFWLCLSSFCIGMFFTNRMWRLPEARGVSRMSRIKDEQLNSSFRDCNRKLYKVNNSTTKTRQVIQTLDRTISNLEMKITAARAEHQSILNNSPDKKTFGRKYFMVIGINTAFSSRKRRDSVRATWMPKGEDRIKLEKEKGIVMRFVIGHSSTMGGILDKAIEAEEKMHGDFLRLDHVEGYLELSAKTKSYFSTAVGLWDADFYVKVDDDIHVNIATLGLVLAAHRMKPRVYVGCMKSGPVLTRKGMKYYEPEYWKFGEVGNRYFRHATGQLYAISKDLATYISVNQHVLHKFANEDVSLGSWLLGLDVEHVDDRRLCCGTPPDCEWKAQAGQVCAASFDWKCSGICRSVEKMTEIHNRCGEGEKVLWSTSFSGTVSTYSQVRSISFLKEAGLI